MDTLETEARVDNLDEVIEFIDSALEKVCCPAKDQMQIDLAVEEIFVNIAHYAYAPKVGMAVISIDISGGQVRIVFMDHGIPYDPLAREDPDITLPPEERGIGGLGIFMVKKSVDDIKYEYKDGQNILTIIKEI